jgi:hypothetical protein
MARYGLAEGTQVTADVTDEPHDSSRGREKTISFAHVARTPDDRDESVSDTQLADQGENSGRCGTRTHDLSRVKAAL